MICFYFRAETPALKDLMNQDNFIMSNEHIDGASGLTRNHQRNQIVKPNTA